MANKDKSYELILETVRVRTVRNKSTAISWYKARKVEYLEGVGKEPEEDLIQIIEVSRRRIK